jgi:sugar phosphate isomerase/epimerase
MKIALDPTPFHHDYELLEFPRVVADLGYEYLQLTPHRDFIPFFNHPRADDDLVARFRKACADAGVGIASVLPVLRWSGPDEDAGSLEAVLGSAVAAARRRLRVVTPYFLPESSLAIALALAGAVPTNAAITISAPVVPIQPALMSTAPARRYRPTGLSCSALRVHKP